LKASISIRLLTIGLLILLLLIPVSMVQDLIKERHERQEEAIKEVSDKWGSTQTLLGLVLTVPYTTSSKVYNNDGEMIKWVESRAYTHFLPDQLNIEGEMLPEMRYRGIYEVTVYRSKMKISGIFSPPNFEDWKIRVEDILWEEAYAALGLSDLRGIQEEVTLHWGNDIYRFKPGIESDEVIQKGISTRILIPPSSNELGAFSLDLSINASTSLSMVPLGKSTLVELNSSWPSPSFDGAFLPDDRTIGQEGFHVSWEVLNLNRSYPQSFRGKVRGIYESAFGVNLWVPADDYQQTMRAAKYASLFIALTFLLFFFVQLLNVLRIHPVQYVIVGLALCVFYTLLIALSEHLSFGLSYLVSSVTIILMITLFAHIFSKKRKLTQVISGILILLYAFIYLIIQIEDYALLVGSLGLLFVLAITMYPSRKIDWHAYPTKSPTKE
jgi:inner membrane protein